MYKDVRFKTYEEGLADAWELAMKICHEPKKGGLSNAELSEIFETIIVERILERFTAEQALAKVEAYEKEKEIKVGDVVIFMDETKGLVVDEALEDTVFILTENGCVEKWERKSLKKTDKHIGIEGLLRQIGE